MGVTRKMRGKHVKGVYKRPYYYPDGTTRNSRKTASNRFTIRRFKDRPCADCGRRYPYWIMDLDHARGKKLFLIGRAKTKSVKMLLAELDKCDVVCSNCHRERTYRRLRGTTTR